MMNALVLCMALAPQSEITVQAHGRRAGEAYELAISGKGRSLPDETIVGVRFRRIANRVEWAGRAIETQPLDRAWGRCVALERGAFHLREPLAGPGEVEITLVFVKPDETASPEAVSGVFRSASVPEVLGALKADAKRMDRALAGARALLDEAASGKGRALRARLDRARAAAQEETLSSLLSATAVLADLFLADLDGAVETAGADALSSISGEPYSFEAARATLEEIAEIFRREKQLVLVRETRWLAREIASRAEAGDGRGWARAQTSLDRALRALHEPVREARSDALKLHLANLEMSFSLAPGMVECPPSVEPEWERLKAELVRDGALLEESLRRGR